MEAIIYRSDDTELLDRLVATFVIGMPVYGTDGSRIGSMLALRRNGTDLVATLEVALPGEEVGTFLANLRRTD